MKKILMKKNTKVGLLIAALAFVGATPEAGAADNIIHPFRSPRAMAMGGVLLTTGNYVENFYGNPARVTADPIWKIQLPDPTLEVNTGAFSLASNLMTAMGGEGDAMSNILSTIDPGSVTHIRYQMAFPGLYWPNVGGGKMSYAFALLTSVQADVQVGSEYRVVTPAIADVGPSFIVGRKFLPEDALSVGISLGAMYRLSSREPIQVQNILQGASLSPLDQAGEGTHFEVGLGSTYRLPIEAGAWNFDVGASLIQILGGGYSNLGIAPAGLKGSVYPQPRSFGFGIAAKRPTWWKFSDFSVALEFQDIGNNANGNFFRLVHIGSEIKWKLISVRAGLNQGYWTAGLGFDLKAIQLDLTTYGEELTYNPGIMQNRIFALRLGFQI